jgi:hypothetical protein
VSSTAQEAKRQWSRKHYQANREKKKEQSRKHYQANREKHRELCRRWHKENPEHCLLIGAIERSKKKNWPCDITLDDIVIPEKCPLLGISLRSNTGAAVARADDNSPTLDRIDSALGYVKGNVWVISYRANRIKNDATLAELETIAKNLRSIQK